MPATHRRVRLAGPGPRQGRDAWVKGSDDCRCLLSGLFLLIKNIKCWGRCGQVRGDEKAIIVARALIEGDVEVRLEPLQPLHIRVGERLTLRFEYHVAESSPRKDAWIMTFMTTHGGVERKAERAHHDTFGVKDEVWDGVEETFVFETPGTVDIAFHAAAVMKRVAWIGGAGAADVKDHAVVGSVHILVLP